MNKETKFKQTEIGEIPEDWEVKELGNKLVNITTGKLNSNAEVVGGKYLFFTCAPHPTKTNTFTFDQKAILLAGNNANGIFHLNYYEGKFDVYQRTYVMSEIDNYDLKYVRYALKQVLRYFKDISQGSATKFLTIKILNELKLKIPQNYEEQKAIAKILSDLDSKIELLQKQNKTLEQIGQTIFKQWFVDFEFPNEEGKPYKSSGGEMVKSELGDIPEGWSVGHLDDGVSSELVKTGINKFENEKTYLATACVEGKNITNTSTKITMTEKPSRANMQSIPNSIWFAKMKDSKKVLLINSQDNWILDNVILSTGFSCIKPLNNMLYYLWIIISSNKFETEKDSLCLGTTMQAINNENIRKINYLIPDTEVITDFNKIVENNFKKISINKSEIKSLQKTRDHLLPKLMSGQIRVPLEVQK